MAKKKRHKVSDHALVRYMERKHGYNFDAMRNEILTPIVLEAIEVKAKSVLSNGLNFRIVDGIIVTIMTE